MRVTAQTRAAVADAAWSVALRLQSFGYAEISSELTISLKQATRIVRAWLKEGAVHHQEGGEGASRKLFAVDPKFVRPATRCARTAEDNMWTAMRRLRTFQPSTIAAHASTDTVAVTVKDASAYCQALLTAGYLSVKRKAAPLMRREAIYCLINETGPRPPVPARVRAVRDPNTGAVIVLGDGK